jgi:hypothetical protein
VVHKRGCQRRFEWDSAPREPLLYSVIADGFNRAYAQSLQADGSEQKIKLTRHQPGKDTLQITGTAVDADTGLGTDRHFCKPFICNKSFKD